MRKTGKNKTGENKRETVRELSFVADGSPAASSDKVDDLQAVPFLKQGALILRLGKDVPVQFHGHTARINS